jgi:hypothetical protein
VKQAMAALGKMTAEMRLPLLAIGEDRPEYANLIRELRNLELMP